MPTLSIVNFNIVCATLGGFITLFGLVSYLLKEKFYLSEALISTFAGLTFSPHATNFIRPLEYASGNEENLEIITLYFSRLVLGVQLVLAGVQLPSKYLKTEWKSLSLLLGPGMCAMWISTSLLVWAMVPDISFLFALAIGSCVTPTDPVLSSGIVKGKFADKNIPPSLQKIIIAESGANDGLGYPFLFLALYLIKYTDQAAHGIETGGAGQAISLWFYETWAYTILLSVAYGAVVGWIAKELLHWAEERRYVDRESFLVFAITLALTITGTVGLIGSDDVLACFIAGNVFTWDDWFRLETEDDSLQPTIDMLLNVSIFMWYGAVCPWHKFVSNDIIPIYRLVPLGIMVLMFRRLPMVLGFHYSKQIHQIEDLKHSIFTGYFGPIGVSAVFYLYISREFLRSIDGFGLERPDLQKLGDAIEIVVWFLVICSVVVHGLSIPLGKLGLYLPRTISTAISTERVSASQSRARSESPLGRHPGEQQAVRQAVLPSYRRSRSTGVSGASTALAWFPRSLARAGKKALDDIKRSQGNPRATSGIDKKDENVQDAARNIGDVQPAISQPMNARILRQVIDEHPHQSNIELSDAKQAEEAPTPSSGPHGDTNQDTAIPSSSWPLRSIQFTNET